MVPDVDKDIDAPFTLGEFKAALHQGKPHSAPGHDGVTWQHLRNLDDSAHLILLDIINTYWASGNVPNDLKLTLVHPMPKTTKTPLC